MVPLVIIFAASVSAELVNFKGTCRLDPHPSVEYRCLLSGGLEGSRACGAAEPAGTVVSPRCRRPNYYSATPLNFMQCFDGYWDYIARCSPECGRVTPDGKGLVVGGVTVKRGELPWHAGVYRTGTDPYMQVCGGSLVSSNVILSAAHCFWTDLEKQLPASKFSVAVGKLYRPWNDQHDQPQKSPVKVIHLPPAYQGAGANYQDDIAVVIVAKHFSFKPYIRPVCLSFDYHFERQQLFSGNKGKVAGWGLTAANGKASPVLQVVELPYVEVGTCINRSPPVFREYITSDKICAGTLDSESALCKGDSGGGLAFPESNRGIERYYLRGVVSTAPSSDEDACNVRSYTSFTSVMKHEHFIKQFWSESGQFKCKDGSFISAANYCDGSPECADESDESEWACGGKTCGEYLFRCEYGACVDRGAACNGVRECMDGSDEAEAVCNKLGIDVASLRPQGGAVPLDTKQGSDNHAHPTDTPPAPAGAVFRSDYKLVPRAGGFFKVHSAPSTWDEASHLCRYEGAVVASPSSAELRAAIRDLTGSSLPKQKAYFVGVRRTFGAHATMPIEGVPAEHLQNEWSVSEASPRDECLSYSEGAVSAHSCGGRLPFLCYKRYSAGDVISPQCGTIDREYQLDAETGRCFKLHTRALPWPRAATACLAEGGHLAVVGGAPLAHVAARVRGGERGPVALGYRQDAHGEWWTVLGQPVGEAGWGGWSDVLPAQWAASGQCGALAEGSGLSALRCDQPAAFLCEKTPSPGDGSCLAAGNVPCSACKAA